MTTTICATHEIRGWFLLGVRGKDTGDIIHIPQPIKAEYVPKYHCFSYVENFTEILPDGREVPGTDLVYVEPIPGKFHKITPIL